MTFGSAAAQAPRILLVIGTSHSGSTVLDAVLDSHPEILAMGELSFLLKDDHGQPRTCACSSLIADCPFWGPVLAAWKSHLSPASPSDYVSLQDRFERFRGILRLGWQRVRPSKEFEAYGRWTNELLKVIANHGSVKLLVDSSKHPPRVLALLLTPGTDLVLVHTVRDPRAVVWSKHKYLGTSWRAGWRKNPLRATLYTAWDWMLVNLSAELILRLRGTPHIRVRYEDLVEKPSREIARVGAVAGIDLAEVGARAEAGHRFAFGHIMAGNRLRHEGARALVLDDEWIRSSPPWVRRLVWVAVGWMARWYGYHR